MNEVGASGQRREKGRCDRFDPIGAATRLRGEVPDSGDGSDEIDFGRGAFGWREHQQLEEWPRIPSHDASPVEPGAEPVTPLGEADHLASVG